MNVAIKERMLKLLNFLDLYVNVVGCPCRPVGGEARGRRDREREGWGCVSNFSIFKGGTHIFKIFIN